MSRDDTRDVVVFTREGCGLCAAAEHAVGRHARHLQIEFVDVDQNPDLQRRYHLRVPVVTLGGVEIHDAGGDLELLDQRLRRAGRRRFGLRGRTS